MLNQEKRQQRHGKRRRVSSLDPHQHPAFPTNVTSRSCTVGTIQHNNGAESSDCLENDWQSGNAMASRETSGTDAADAYSAIVGTKEAIGAEEFRQTRSMPECLETFSAVLHSEIALHDQLQAYRREQVSHFEKARRLEEENFALQKKVQKLAKSKKKIKQKNRELEEEIEVIAKLRSTLT